MKLHNEAAGWFKLDVLDAEGNKKRSTGWFKNLITDAGLDYMADNSNWLQYCQVGTGSATPSSLDTALSSRIAGTTTQTANINGAQSAAPYYTWRRRTMRFADGAAAGNISEVGMGWALTGSLFSRALVVDSGGSPTSITVGAGETLDVTYEIRFYPKLTDDTGTVVLTGGIGGTYDYVMRAAVVTFNRESDGWAIGVWGSFMDYGSAGYCYARAGDIEAITSEPSGANFPASSGSWAAYETGSLERKFTLTWGPSEGNIPGGIRSFAVKMGIGRFQFRVGLDGTDAKIPKTADDELSLTFVHSWGRRA